MHIYLYIYTYQYIYIYTYQYIHTRIHTIYTHTQIIALLHGPTMFTRIYIYTCIHTCSTSLRSNHIYTLYLHVYIHEL